MKHLIFALCLVASFAQAQVSQRYAARIYRVGDQLVIADSLGSNQTIYPFTVAQIVATNSLVRVNISGLSKYYTPPKILNSSGVAYSTTSTTAAVAGILATVPDGTVPTSVTQIGGVQKTIYDIDKAATDLSLSTKLTTVSSIASLTALDRNGLTSVNVTDQQTGGLFTYFSSGFNSNGGTVFLAKNGGFWVRQFSGALYPEMFEAVGYERIYPKTSGGNEGYYADASFTIPVKNSTVAIQKMLDYASRVNLTKKDYKFSSGIYIVNTLYVPEGTDFHGVTPIEYGASTVFQQAWGSTSDVIRFRGHTTNGAQWWYGKASDFTVRGNYQNPGVAGWLVSFRDVSDVLIRPQDQTILKNIVVEGGGSGGLRMENGALPLTLSNIRPLNNNGDGIYIVSPAANIIQSITLNEISGDANNGALIHLKGFDSNGSVNILNFKSENRVNDFYGSAKMQANALLFEDCDKTPIHILGGTHLCSTSTGASFDKPGDVITITSAGELFPNLTWNSVTVRVRPGDVGTDPLMVKATNLAGPNVRASIPYKDPVSGNLNNSGTIMPGGMTGNYTYSTSFMQFHVIGASDYYKARSVEGPGLQIQGITPGISFHETDQTTHKKAWLWTASGGVFQIRGIKDDGTLGSIGMTFQKGVSGNISKVTIDAPFQFSALPTYADNAAAIAAGLIVGDIYKTTTGEIRIRF